MIYSLKGDKIGISVASRGAELMSVKDNAGTEYLWGGNPKYWSERSPILFPIVGSLRNDRAYLGDITLKMPRHGIIKGREFSHLASGDNSIAFVIKADSLSKEAYPFDFEVVVEYTIDGSSLITKYIIRNNDNKDMPCVIGGHPAFNCPIHEGEDFEDYIIKFEYPEIAHCPQIDPPGIIHVENTKCVLNNSDTINLSHELMRNDALVFTNLVSRKVSLINKNTARGIQMDFNGFNYLGIWSASNDAPFVALEPWIGCATCSDESDDFKEKRNMLTIAPGGTFEVSYKITVL